MTTYGNMTDLTNLSLVLTVLWERELQTTSPLDPLYAIATSTRAAERTQELGNFGLVPEYNGAIEHESIVLGDRKVFEHTEYAKAHDIPRKLLDDDEYAAIGRITSNMALAFTRTRAYHKAAVFNQGFATTYTVADGRALCTATGRNSGKADTRNRGTSALSHEAVVATREAMMSWTDSNGLPIMANPDTLVVPVALKDAAMEITGSVQRPDNANNAINVNAGMNVIVDRFLTDSNNWFMVDSQLSRQHLWWWDRVLPEFSVHPASEYDLKLMQRGYMRYSFGADDHIWVYGHEVAE